MTDYYFTENPNAEHAEETWTFELKKNFFTFTTDKVLHNC